MTDTDGEHKWSDAEWEELGPQLEGLLRMSPEQWMVTQADPSTIAVGKQ